jgi:CheY-like chemotaxis protein
MAKVLVAEDDQSSRVTLKHIIEGMGHSVILSPDGEHAFATLETNSDINLLITDVMMPKLDGQELIRKVRDTESLSKMPIIIISGVVGPKAIHSFLEGGATWFLAKPLEVAAVKDYVQRALGK